jgi:hypothetical protein
MTKHEIKIEATYRGIPVMTKYQGLDEYDYGLSAAWIAGVDAALDHVPEGVEIVNEAPNTRVFCYEGAGVVNTPTRWYVQDGQVLFRGWDGALKLALASIEELEDEDEFDELDRVYIDPTRFVVGGRL